MPINIPIAQTFEADAQQMMGELLRRAVDGSIPLPDTKGIILASPNGTNYRLGASNDGAVTLTAI